MRRRSFLLSLLTTMMVAMLNVGFMSCSGGDDDDPNPDNGQPINPGTTVNDPEGTISLSMRNADNGKTYLDNIYISNENFRGAYFVSVGAVKGLGNVSTIPTTGWAEQMSVIAGNGYVAYSNGQFYRIYAVSEIEGTSGGVIGADIKYQKPFKGVDEAISINEKNLTFDKNGGSQSLVFNNKNIVLFEVDSDQDWCKVQKSSTYDYYFLYNAVTISAKPSTELSAETANVTLRTIYGKEVTIKVTRAGAEPILTAEMDTKEINPDAQTFQIGINTNYDTDNLQVSSNNDWLSVEITDGTSDTKTRAAQVKYIEQNHTTRAGSNNNAAKSCHLEVTTKSNYNSTARQGTITIKSRDGKKSTNIFINQQNAELSMENNTLSLTAREVSSASQTFRTNIKSEYLQISSDASWCNVWLDNNKLGLFHYSVTANTTGEERKATITIKPKEGNLSPLVITINQALPVITLSKEKLWFDRNNGNQTITVTHELGAWEVESPSASWCTCSKNGNSLTIRVTSTNTDREATIRFKNNSKTIIVVQSKYAVGDDYNENGINGKVAYMQDEVRLIYREVGKAAWSKEFVTTGASDINDGRNNMSVIKQIANWQELYPAFALCDELNVQGVTGWYLPSYKEIQNIPSSDNAWSSTESTSSTITDMQGGSIKCAYTKWQTKFSEYWFPTTNKGNVFCIVAIRRF